MYFEKIKEKSSTLDKNSKNELIINSLKNIKNIEAIKIEDLKDISDRDELKLKMEKWIKDVIP
jgi:hypothetical protein